MSAIGNEICELLIDLGYITSEQLSDAITEQEESGDRITLVLSRLGLVTERQFKDALELQFGVNYINLSLNRPEDEIVKLVSEDVARKHKFVPVALKGEQYSVAMVDPDDLIAADAVRSNLGSENFKKLVCTADDFDYLMHITYIEPPEEVVENDENGTESHQVQDSEEKSKPSKKITSLFSADDDDDFESIDKERDSDFSQEVVSSPVDEIKNLKKSFENLFEVDEDFEDEKSKYDSRETTENLLNSTSVKEEVGSIINSLETEAIDSTSLFGEDDDDEFESDSKPTDEQAPASSEYDLGDDPVSKLIRQAESETPTNMSLFGEDDDDEFESDSDGTSGSSSPGASTYPVDELIQQDSSSLGSGSLFDDDDDDDFEDSSDELVQPEIDTLNLATEVEETFESIEQKKDEEDAVALKTKKASSLFDDDFEATGEHPVPDFDEESQDGNEPFSVASRVDSLAESINEETSKVSSEVLEQLDSDIELEVESRTSSLFGDDDEDDLDSTFEDVVEEKIDGASMASELDSIFDSFEGEGAIATKLVNEGIEGRLTSVADDVQVANLEETIAPNSGIQTSDTLDAITESTERLHSRESNLNEVVDEISSPASLNPEDSFNPDPIKSRRSAKPTTEARIISTSQEDIDEFSNDVFGSQSLFLADKLNEIDNSISEEKALSDEELKTAQESKELEDSALSIEEAIAKELAETSEVDVFDPEQGQLGTDTQDFTEPVIANTETQADSMADQQDFSEQQIPVTEENIGSVVESVTSEITDVSLEDDLVEKDPGISFLEEIVESELSIAQESKVHEPDDILDEDAIVAPISEKEEIADAELVGSKGHHDEALQFLPHTTDEFPDYSVEVPQYQSEAVKSKVHEEARLLAEREEQARAEEEARLLAERQAQARAEEEARLLAERQAQARAEEEARLLAEREAQARVEEEARLLAEREEQARAEEEARLLAEREAQARVEEEARLLAEREEQARAEEEARLLAERQEQARAEEEARLLAERQAQARAEEEARLLAEREAQARAEEEARLLAEREEQARAEEEARLLAERQEQARAEEEARLLAERQAQARAEEEARLLAEREEQARAEEEARLLAERQAQARAEEEARLLAERQAQARAEEEARLLAEREEQARAEEEARLLAERQAQAEAEEEARLLAERQAQARAEEARLLAERQAQARAEEARLLAERQAQAGVEEEAQQQRQVPQQQPLQSVPAQEEQQLVQQSTSIVVDPAVVNYAKEILIKAIELQCTDVHFELVSDGLQLRYMMDGQQLADITLQAEIAAGLAASYKFIAGLEVDVTDRQQAKAFTSPEFGNTPLVVQTIPSGNAEIISISIQNQ